MKKRRRLPPVGDAGVDMTPMLDIVFIMLIFFIVSSTLVRESGLDVTQQRNDDEEQQNNNTAIVVRLCNNNDVYIDRRAVDLRSVRANVEKKLADDANAVVVVEVEQQAPTGSLVKVMDQAIAADAPVSVAPNPASCETNTVAAR